MKRISLLTILSLTLVLFVFAVSSEEEEKLNKSDKFTVINVQGTILFVKSGERMKRGDIYVQGMPLNFKDEIARAAIMNKLQGRLVLTGNNRGKIKVLPAANNISSRSGAILNVIDLKNHFTDRMLVINEAEVEISEEAFPMNDKTFFYLTYQHNGEEIPKKLPFEGNKLILDKEEIYKIDGEPIPYEEKEMVLYYREDGAGTKISEFTPVFPDETSLKEEISLLLELMGDESDNQKIEEVTAHLNEFYGKPQKSNLNNWLKEEFEIEKTK